MSEDVIANSGSRRSEARTPVLEDSAMVEERRRLLLDAVQEVGRVVASEEAVRFGVSEDTIRRDLRVMAAEGLVQRVRGGALPVAEPPVAYTERVVAPAPEAVELARRTASYLSQSGGVIVLDGGTTNLLIAHALEPSDSMTVVTSSPDIAAAAMHRGCPVLMLGGVVDPTLGAAVDATATLALTRVQADIAVLGACAVHPNRGVTTTRPDEVEFKRTVVASGGEVIVVATDDKLLTSAPFVVTDVASVDRLVCMPGRGTAEFAELGVEVLDG